MIAAGGTSASTAKTTNPPGGPGTKPQLVAILAYNFNAQRKSTRLLTLRSRKPPVVSTKLG